MILVSHRNQYRNLKRKVWTFAEICKLLLQLKWSIGEAKNWTSGKITNNFSNIHKFLKRLCSIQLFHLFKDYQCCLEFITLESLRFSLIIPTNSKSPKQTEPTSESNLKKFLQGYKQQKKFGEKQSMLWMTCDPNFEQKSTQKSGKKSLNICLNLQIPVPGIIGFW